MRVHILFRGVIVALIFFSLSPVVWESRAVSATPAPEELARFIKEGVFDPQRISEDALFEALTTAYRQETDPEKLKLLAGRLLLLKWWRLWDANFEMAAETVIVGDPLERAWRPSDNWQWAEIPHLAKGAAIKRAHFGAPANAAARHGVSGVWPALLPVNGVLLQYVYFPDKQLPEQITLRIETSALLGQQQPVFVQARWTKAPEQHFATENRPPDFWAGTLPTPSPSQEGIFGYGGDRK
jgi:hypothetical protein